MHTPRRVPRRSVHGVLFARAQDRGERAPRDAREDVFVVEPRPLDQPDRDEERGERARDDVRAPGSMGFVGEHLAHEEEREKAGNACHAARASSVAVRPPRAVVPDAGASRLAAAERRGRASTAGAAGDPSGLSTRRTRWLARRPGVAESRTGMSPRAARARVLRGARAPRRQLREVRIVHHDPARRFRVRTGGAGNGGF